jgi:hypothetical protein
LTSNLKDRIQFILLLLICSLIITYNYLEWKYLGFPDGHLTELDNTQLILLPVFSVLYTGILLIGIYQLMKKRINLKRQRSWLFILLAMQFVLSYVLAQLLKHGARG